jgi:hypothetical protein
MGVVAGVDVRFYTRDVEGQALKPDENGLRVPPVRDMENNTYPFVNLNERLRQVSLSV